MRRGGADKEQPADQKQPMPEAKRSRWRRRGLAAALAVVSLRLALGAIGDFLMVETTVPYSDAAVILGGDDRLRAVAQLYANGIISEVWLTQDRPDYLVANGLLPPQWEVSRDKLIAAGIPPERIVLLDGTITDLTDAGRVIKAKLEDIPQSSVLAVCPAFASRHLRIVFDNVLGEPLASQVQIRGLPYQDFDTSHWWHSRIGWKQVLSQLCSIGFTLVQGTGPQDTPAAMDPDAFEQHLLHNFGEAACHAF